MVDERTEVETLQFQLSIARGATRRQRAQKAAAVQLLNHIERELLAGNVGAARAALRQRRDEIELRKPNVV